MEGVDLTKGCAEGLPGYELGAALEDKGVDADVPVLKATVEGEGNALHANHEATMRHMCVHAWRDMGYGNASPCMVHHGDKTRPLSMHMHVRIIWRVQVRVCLRLG